MSEQQVGTRIDWERVIIEIQRSSGMRDLGDRLSIERIAELCGRSFGWCWNLKNIPGTEPKFADGVRLLAIWAEQTGRPTREAPMQSSGI